MNVEEFKKQMLQIFDDVIEQTKKLPKEATFKGLRIQYAGVLEEFHALKESTERLLTDNIKLYKLRNDGLKVITMLTEELAKHEPIVPKTPKDVN